MCIPTSSNGLNVEFSDWIQCWSCIKFNMLSDLNIRSWREIFTGEFLYSKLEQAAATWDVFSCQQTGKKKPGDSHESDGDARRLPFGFKLQILVSLRVWWKVLYLPIQVSLSTGHKEISPKKCPATDHPGGTPINSCWGCAARFSKSWPYFRPKQVWQVIFHTHRGSRFISRAVKTENPLPRFFFLLRNQRETLATQAILDLNRSIK